MNDPEPLHDATSVAAALLRLDECDRIAVICDVTRRLTAGRGAIIAAAYAAMGRSPDGSERL